MTVALFSFVGIVVGASLQYFFTRVIEERRHKRDLMTRAYTDYLRSVSEAAHCLIQRQSGEGRKLLAQITDAKVRVCLYGSQEVVEKLAAFEKTGAVIRSESQRNAFVQLLRAMRTEDNISNRSLETIMLGEDAST